MAKAKFYGTGRRKKSVARVYLVPGTGNITINKRDIDEYLGLETLKVVVRQPLVATDNLDKFDVLVNVKGGGYTGQAGAIRHGIARALLQVDAETLCFWGFSLPSNLYGMSRNVVEICGYVASMQHVCSKNHSNYVVRFKVNR